MAGRQPDLRAPLLEAADDYHEGCPGCELERRKIAANGSPKRELAFVAYMVVCNALPISSLFPFIYFMVRDFHIAKDITRIGSYAGSIGSALMLGRFLTSMPWGIFADRYGRKPVMIFGTATIVVFNTIFGFSPNFWMALTSRFLLGSLNGMLGSVRAYAAEMCSQEHQAFGLSMVGTMWNFGLIIGPAIGGYLAQPADKYPSLFPRGSLFDRFPYALPCSAISAFAFIGLIMSFWLPESLHKHESISKSSHANGKEGSFTKKNGFGNKDDKEYVIDVPTKETEKPVWKNLGLVAAISVYCIWGLHDIAYSEILSLWAVSPQSYEGLGFTTSQVGIVLAGSGIALPIFQLFVFAPVANRFGPIQLIRIPSVLTLPLVAVYPLFSRLHGATLWAVLITAAVLKNIFSICIITGTFILINNAVVSKQRGLANGISMSCMSLFKAIGPASAGVVFSWAQERIHASFLPGMWAVFVLLNMVALITLLCTFEPIMPKSLLSPALEKHERKQEQKFERSNSFTFD